MRTWLHHFISSSGLSPRPHMGHALRTTPVRSPNKFSIERFSLVRSSRLAGSKGASPSTPASPRPPRARAARRHSWCLTVDAENQEPPKDAAAAAAASTDAPQRTPRRRASRAAGKKGAGAVASRSQSPTAARAKGGKAKLGSLKKTSAVRTLTFCEAGEGSAAPAEDPAKATLQAPKASKGAAPVDGSDKPACVQKEEKLRRQRSKGLVPGTKKLKRSQASSANTEVLKTKESAFYGLPSLDAPERKCSPLANSQVKGNVIHT